MYNAGRLHTFFTYRPLRYVKWHVCKVLTTRLSLGARDRLATTAKGDSSIYACRQCRAAAYGKSDSKHSSETYKITRYSKYAMRSNEFEQGIRSLREVNHNVKFASGGDYRRVWKRAFWTPRLPYIFFIENGIHWNSEEQKQGQEHKATHRAIILTDMEKKETKKPCSIDPDTRKATLECGYTKLFVHRR